MYKIENFSYSIENKKILENINLEIKPNKFLSIVGANGCGKSTLLKAINRNISFTEGSILLQEKDINSYSDKELALKRSVLNQSFHFPYSFKAIDIVEMGLYSYDCSASEKKDILKFIVNKLDINELAQKDYIYLSGGEKQKIQFARVVTQIFASKEKEKYLFLDEPTLNLDIFYQYKILDLVKELVTELGIGVCAILHDINQAYIYSDEIAMIKNKTIKYYGSNKETLTKNNIYEVFKVKSDFVYSQELKQTILVTSI